MRTPFNPVHLAKRHQAAWPGKGLVPKRWTKALPQSHQMKHTDQNSKGSDKPHGPWNQLRKQARTHVLNPDRATVRSVTVSPHV